MKILLIQPPIQDFYQTSIRTQPIGLAYLAASLQKHGHEVEILDCQTEKKRSIPIPSELSYLKDFYPFNDRSPFKLYSGYYHFGMSWDEIRRKIEDSKADVFGISSNFTPYHGEALEIARIIKEWDRRKIVVMGGAHVSCDPDGVLKNPLVDYVILGEGEIRFPLLLEQIEKGKIGKIEEIDGIGYRVNGEIRISPLKNFVKDLDSLPSSCKGTARSRSISDEEETIDHDHHQQGMSTWVCLLFNPSRHGSLFSDTISRGHLTGDGGV